MLDKLNTKQLECSQTKIILFRFDVESWGIPRNQCTMFNESSNIFAAKPNEKFGHLLEMNWIALHFGWICAFIRISAHTDTHSIGGKFGFAFFGWQRRRRSVGWGRFSHARYDILGIGNENGIGKVELEREWESVNSGWCESWTHADVEICILRSLAFREFSRLSRKNGADFMNSAFTEMNASWVRKYGTKCDVFYKVEANATHTHSFQHWIYPWWNTFQLQQVSRCQFYALKALISASKNYVFLPFIQERGEEKKNNHKIEK